MFADRDGQISLSLFSRLEDRIGDPEGGGADITQRPKPLENDCDADDRHDNQRIRRDRALLDDVNQVQTLLRLHQSFLPNASVMITRNEN